jgi:hypothetical protein
MGKYIFHNMRNSGKQPAQMHWVERYVHSYRRLHFELLLFFVRTEGATGEINLVQRAVLWLFARAGIYLPTAVLVGVAFWWLPTFWFWSQLVGLAKISVAIAAMLTGLFG